jgi:hypothetical protein
LVGGFQCCFCSQGIEDIDPLGFRVELTRIAAPDHPDRGWQELYAHAACLEKTLPRDVDFDAQRFLNCDAEVVSTRG